MHVNIHLPIIKNLHKQVIYLTANHFSRIELLANLWISDSKAVMGAAKPSCYNVCKYIWNEAESLLGSIIIITLWFEFNWGIVRCKFLQYLPTIFCLFLGLLTRFQLCRSFLAILSWVFVQVLILFLNEPVGGQPHSQGLHLPTPEAGWVPSLPLGWGVKDPGNEVGVWGVCLFFNSGR